MSCAEQGRSAIKIGVILGCPGTDLLLNRKCPPGPHKDIVLVSPINFHDLTGVTQESGKQNAKEWKRYKEAAFDAYQTHGGKYNKFVLCRALRSHEAKDFVDWLKTMLGERTVEIVYITLDDHADNVFLTQGLNNLLQKICGKAHGCGSGPGALNVEKILKKIRGEIPANCKQIKILRANTAMTSWAILRENTRSQSEILEDIERAMS